MTGKPKTGKLSTILALLVALALTLILLVAGSDTPFRAVAAFFAGPFSTAFAFGNMLAQMSLLSLTGLGVVWAFTAGVFNLGGEGQVAVAALAVAMAALGLAGMPGWLAIPLLLLTGSAAGALMAGASGVLLRYLKTDELISSFLLSAAAIPIVNYLIQGPLRDETSNLLATPGIPRYLRFPSWLPPSSLSAGILIALLLIVLSYFVMYRTLPGYELRLTGLNREFARYGGIPVGLYTVLPMALSGAFSGLAGSLAVLSSQFAAFVGQSGGLGWNGIAVALIARNHPALVLPAAFASAFLRAGSQSAMLYTDLSLEVGGILQGVVFLLVTAEIGIPALRKWRRGGSPRSVSPAPREKEQT